MSGRTTKDATHAIHAASGRRPLFATVNPAIQRGSTIIASSAKALYDGSENTYGRPGLEPQGALCQALAELEGGVRAFIYPSGLAAISGVLLALLKAGDEILAVDCIYSPTRRFCDNHLARFGVTTRYVDPWLSAEDMLALATPATRLILLESPGSLTFEVQDVPAIAALARARGILTVIDNTFGAGLICKPLALGVDVSLQALTKYVGGHADVFMGAACAADPAIIEQLEASEVQIGWTTSPDDAYLMLRGLRTLPTRLARHGQSALIVADWLASQPQVKEVICPALPGGRGHERFKQQYTGANGLFSFVLNPAKQSAVLAFLDRLELFGLGFSWGGYESLALNCDPQFSRRTLRPRFGGPLIRLHVGLEDPQDLIEDLRAGFQGYA
jgi:cystathionine beta-lyase